MKKFTLLAFFILINGFVFSQAQTLTFINNVHDTDLDVPSELKIEKLNFNISPPAFEAFMTVPWFYHMMAKTVVVPDVNSPVGFDVYRFSIGYSNPNDPANQFCSSSLNGAAPTDVIQLFPNTNKVVAFGGEFPCVTMDDILTKDHEVPDNAQADKVNISFFHGSPDAPPVSLVGQDGIPLFTNVAFGEFGIGTKEVNANDTLVMLTDAAGNILARYRFDMGFWKGRTATIFTAGYTVNPALFNGFRPTFELWAALSNGGTLPLEETQPTNTDKAFIQIIHDFPKDAGESNLTNLFDVQLTYSAINTLLVTDSMAFRTATPFLEVDAGTNLEMNSIRSLVGTNAGTLDNITLEKDQSYIFVLSRKIVGMNPNGTQQFQNEIKMTTAQRSAGTGKMNINYFNGAPEASTISLTIATSLNIEGSYGPLASGAFSTYQEVAAVDDLIFRLISSDGTPIPNYTKDFAFWEGQSGMVFTSGFLDPDDNESELDVWIALSSGGTFSLAKPDYYIVEEQPIAISVFPNPTVSDLNIEYELEGTDLVHFSIIDMVGKPIAQYLTVGFEGENEYMIPDMEELPNGIYTLVLENGEQRMMERFTKFR